MMGELLGRLHALPYDDSARRPGGASGEDPSREGTPRQDLLAALAFLDAVDMKVATASVPQGDKRGPVAALLAQRSGRCWGYRGSPSLGIGSHGAAESTNWWLPRP